jgi:hypothetical protein
VGKAAMMLFIPNQRGSICLTRAKDITWYFTSRSTRSVNWSGLLTTSGWVLISCSILLIPGAVIELLFGPGSSDAMKSVLFLLLVAVILWWVGNVYETYHRSGIEGDLPIYSLRDRIELHGGFVLSTGSIDHEDYDAF